MLDVRPLRVLLLALLLPAVAGAAVLATVPLKRGATGGISCRMMNVGTKPITIVGFRINEITGAGYGFTGCNDGTEVQPGFGCQAVITNTSACNATPCRCKLEFTGSKSSVRGALVVSDGAGIDAAVAPLQ